MPDARIPGAGDLAKIAPDHVAIRVLELGMIEDIEEFGAKPALKGKRAEDLTDMSLVRELEKERFFERPADNPAMHGDRAE